MSLRPSLLDPLFAPAAALPGVGPKIAPLLDRLLGEPGTARAGRWTCCFTCRAAASARELKGSIADAPVGEPVTLAVTVVAHRPPPPGRSRAPYRVLVEDETGDVTLVFFNGQRPRLEKLLPVGERRFVSGKIELWDGMRQMVHPDRVLDERGLAGLPAVEAVYGLTEGLSSRMVGRFAAAALDTASRACPNGRIRPGSTATLAALRRRAARPAPPETRRQTLSRGGARRLARAAPPRL